MSAPILQVHLPPPGPLHDQPPDRPVDSGPARHDHQRDLVELSRPGPEAAHRELGSPVAGAQNLRTIAHAPWLLIPGIAVVIAILSFNFLGDGLRDAADPYRQ